MTHRQGLIDRHHFLFRRLHSLTGILPVGVFLIGHLLTNSTILWGAVNARAADPFRDHDGGLTLPAETSEYFARRVGAFQHEVSFINESVPFLILIEVTLWASIAFHSILGIYYATTGRRNTRHYAYWDNWRYALQRWTGYIGVLFIFYHVATLRWGWHWLVPGGAVWSHQYAASTLVQSLHGSTDGIGAWGILVSLLYFLGVTALVFHFANGLWTAAITWGLTVTDAAQRRWAWACGAIGVGLMMAGWGALFGFLMLDYHDARAIEDAMRRAHAPTPDLVTHDTPTDVETASASPAGIQE